MLKDVLYFVYNPFIVTGLSNKKMEKDTSNMKVRGTRKFGNFLEETALLSDEDFGKALFTSENFDITCMFDYLIDHNTGKDENIAYVQAYIKAQPEEYREIYKQIFTKELKALKQYSELEIELMVEKAIQDNSFKDLPSSIKEKYTIKDYICYYDFTEERKNETKAFIDAKIDEIEKFEDKKSWWEPKEISPYTSFYCQNLCNHRQRCEYLQDFLDALEMYKEDKENKEIDNELDKFIF